MNKDHPQIVLCEPSAEWCSDFGSVPLDKDGMLAQLQTLISSIETPTPRPPSQHEFLEVVNNFLYHAVWTTKHLRRGMLGLIDEYLNHNSSMDLLVTLDSFKLSFKHLDLLSF